MIVYSPMQSGLLTDAFTAERAAALRRGRLAPAIRRVKPPNLDAQPRARRRAAAGRRATHGDTVAAVAVAWALAWPGISAAIVGARSPEQVDGWLGAAALRLDEDDLATVAAAIERTGAGAGPVVPPPA